MRRIVRVLVFGAAVTLVAGCGSSSDGTDTRAATGAGTTTAPSASTPTETQRTETEVPTAAVVSVAYVGGKVTGDTDASLALGEQVELVVTSDVADEVHLHGYDKTVDVTPAGPATLRFTADIPGSFEVELEGKGLVLTELTVK